ncbi:MAG: glycine zipper domain-containing protein [Pirellulaceae bacterium]
MSIYRNVLSSLIIVSSVTQGFAQANRNAGAALGGVAGAAVGAAIGENNDEPLAGALIGGALGLITGATVGQAKDNNIARQQAYAAQQYQQRMSGAVSTYDVAQMTRSGLGPQVVINHIHQNGVQKRPDVNDIIWLHQQGVPEPIISAMQNAPVGSPAYAPPTTVVTAPAPVVVEEYHYVAPAPRVIYHPGYYHRHHRHRHYPGRSGYSFGFSVSR